MIDCSFWIPQICDAVAEYHRSILGKVFAAPFARDQIDAKAGSILAHRMAAILFHINKSLTEEIKPRAKIKTSKKAKPNRSKTRGRRKEAGSKVRSSDKP